MLPKDMSGKLKSAVEITAIAAQARRDGQIVVFTNGCFDLVHRGHVHLLRAAKAAGDLLIVALNSDRSVKEIKGPRRPIMPQTDRIELIAAMEMVDCVVLFDEPDPTALIDAIKPDVLAKGARLERRQSRRRESGRKERWAGRAYSLLAGILN